MGAIKNKLNFDIISFSQITMAKKNIQKLKYWDKYNLINKTTPKNYYFKLVENRHHGLIFLRFTLFLLIFLNLLIHQVFFILIFGVVLHAFFLLPIIIVHVIMLEPALSFLIYPSLRFYLHNFKSTFLFQQEFN